MFALERTVPGSQDLDWLPPSMKMIRWTVAGSIWTGLTGAVAAVVIASKGHGVYVWGKGIAALAMGGWYAGDRAARAVMRSRLGKLARGAADLRSLSNEADGELLHARGKVKAQETLPSFITDEPCVYRRLVVTLENVRLIHEAAVDFSLVDETGERVHVQVEGARLLAPEPKKRPFPVERVPQLALLTLPEKFGVALARWNERKGKGKRTETIQASEYLVRPGDALECVGYKTRVVDPSVAVLERETPMRATLRSGHALPLLLAPPA